MQVTVTMRVMQEYLPSPRHKIKRQREVDMEFKATLREVSALQAPVAIIQRGYGEHGFGIFPRSSTITFRWFAGRLWARPRLNRFSARPKRNSYATWREAIKYCRSYSTYRAGSRAERRKQVTKWFAQFLLVDGVLHQCIGEPRYVIHTFGLGSNHGGTAVMSDTKFNSNIGRDYYFRLDQREQAIALADKIARKRGDTNALPIKPHDRFEILIPGAIRVNPRRHGRGNPFQNRLNALTASTDPAALKGLLVVATALKKVR
jgi:hypothetical protein